MKKHNEKSPFLIGGNEDGDKNDYQINRISQMLAKNVGQSKIF